MLNASFLTQGELEQLGFAELGRDVLVHKTCVLLRTDRMSLGDGVRIDPFCVVSAAGGLNVGAYSHIASHCVLSATHGITIGAFSGVSHGSRIFSASDDYRNSGLLGPQAPEDLRVVRIGHVSLGKHSCLGANCVVLPGATLEEGATVGALALVHGVLPQWCVYAGIPARRIGERPREGVLAAEEVFLARLRRPQ